MIPKNRTFVAAGPRRALVLQWFSGFSGSRGSLGPARLRVHLRRDRAVKLRHEGSFLDVGGLQDPELVIVFVDDLVVPVSIEVDRRDEVPARRGTRGRLRSEATVRPPTWARPRPTRRGPQRARPGSNEARSPRLGGGGPPPGGEGSLGARGERACVVRGGFVFVDASLEDKGQRAFRVVAHGSGVRVEIRCEGRSTHERRLRLPRPTQFRRTPECEPTPGFSVPSWGGRLPP